MMVACLSPADNNYDETLSTLRYANRAKNIKNKPKINEDPKDALLRQYAEEIEKLKAMLMGKIPIPEGGFDVAASSMWRFYINNNNNRIQRHYSRFSTISSQRRELSPARTLKWPRHNRVQITCNTSSVYHVQVSCYMPLGMKGQLSYQVWQSWNRIYLSFILLAEPLNQWRRGRNRSTRRKPLTTSFRKYHILQPKDSSPKRDSNPCSSIGGRLGKQTC